MITRQTVADNLTAYLRHECSLSNLVTWAETVIMEDEFDHDHFSDVRDVVALGLADVRAFGLTWDDSKHLLRRLGYSARIQIEAT